MHTLIFLPPLLQFGINREDTPVLDKLLFSCLTEGYLVGLTPINDQLSRIVFIYVTIWVCNISFTKGKFHSVYFVTFYRIKELHIKNHATMAGDVT